MRDHPARDILKLVRPLLGQAQLLTGPIIDPRCMQPTWRGSGLLVLASVEKKPDGYPWYHVSFSRADRVPDYGDTLLVRRAMFRPDALAVMVFPPAQEHVNIHEFCLHLWQRVSTERLLPDLREWDGQELAI